MSQIPCVSERRLGLVHGGSRQFTAVHGSTRVVFSFSFAESFAGADLSRGSVAPRVAAFKKNRIEIEKRIKICLKYISWITLNNWELENVGKPRYDIGIERGLAFPGGHCRCAGRRACTSCAGAALYHWSHWAIAGPEELIRELNCGVCGAFRKFTKFKSGE